MLSNKLSKLSKALVLGTLSLYSLGVTQAQENVPVAAVPGAPLGVGFVNPQEVLQGAIAFIGAQEVINKQQQVYQKEIATQEARLQAQMEASKTEAEKRKINQEMAKLRAKADEYRRRLEAAMGRVLETMQQTCMNIVQAIAVANKLSIVFQKQAAVWAAPEVLDITKAVLDQVNQKVKSIPVTFEPDGPAVGASGGAFPVDEKPIK